MKKVILALALIATPALAATDIVMHRDPGCGCCEKWAAQVSARLAEKSVSSTIAIGVVFSGLPGSRQTSGPAIPQ